MIELRKRPLDVVPDVQVDQAVAEVRPDQELSGQVGDDFVAAACGRHALQRVDVVVDHAIADGVGQSHVPVVAGRLLRQLGLKAPQVLDQRTGDGVGPGPGANACDVDLASSSGRSLHGCECLPRWPAFRLQQ